MTASFGTTPRPGSVGRWAYPSSMRTGLRARWREISLGSTQYSMTNALGIAQRKCSDAAVLILVVKL